MSVVNRAPFAAVSPAVVNDRSPDFPMKRQNGVKDVYEDASRTTDARVRDLLARMSVEEKTC